MTLITYLNRVHFADGVLEEALRSELEHHQKRNSLLVVEQADLEGAQAERLLSSFPTRNSVEAFVSVPSLPTEAAALQVAERYKATARDHLVVFGTSRAIDLAKVARVAIAYDEPLAALTNSEGGARRIGDRLPDLYAVPSIAGFASAVTDYARVKLTVGGQALISSRKLIPTVTICDPTVTLGSSPAASASAASGTMSRGVESYLSRSYNPPADGLALDAISRTVRHLGCAMHHDQLVARREMMAGSLNSALSLQKGLCAIHAVTNALASVSEAQIDPCAVGRLLLPGVLRFYADHIETKAAPLRQALGLGDREDLPDGIAQILADLPLPNSLSEMGLTAEHIAKTAEIAAKDRALGASPRQLGQIDIHDMLCAVH